MPKSVWSAVIALGYLLGLLALKMIRSFQALPGLGTMRASVEAWVLGQSEWDQWIVGLFMFGIGALILWGLIKGGKPARYASLLIFSAGFLLTLGGYMSGVVSGTPARWDTAFQLFLYLLPHMVILLSLCLPSARVYYGGKIAWRSFGRWFGLGVAGVILLMVSWSFFMVWLSKDVPVGK